MKKGSYVLTKRELEDIKYPCVISLKENAQGGEKHKIVEYNSSFLKNFIYLLKDEGIIFLEELFGPVFEETGLTFFTFENQFYYLFNIPFSFRYMLHIFIQEKEWLRFPYWFNTERLASLGKLAGEISHELKNPLSGILLYATMLKEELPENSIYSEWINRIIHLTNRCKNITTNLLSFGRPEKDNKEWVDVNESARKVAELLSGYEVFKNIRINWKLKEKLPRIYVNRTQIEQVFFNIFINAAEAMKGYGEITVETFIKNDKLCIKIKDTGPGISSKIMPFIFDPFFTTKDKNKGTGLGLSVCYGIIKNHRGKIRVYNLREGGACFEISFPLYTREALREDEV